MARNRVIYQSQALFIAPTSTGAQVSGTGGTAPNFGPTTLAALTGTAAIPSQTLLKKLDRIQSCNFNFTVNRQDINEFGKLARLDSIVTESPTVGLDFSYYVTDGLNERLMGFNITGGTNDSPNTASAQALSGLLADQEGNNYYILTVQDGEDVVNDTASSLTPANSNTIIGIGNGFINEYSFEAAVGAIPTATVTVEAYNIKCDSLTGIVGAGSTNVVVTGYSPAVNVNASPVTKLTDVKQAYLISGAFNTGVSSVTALRPGDVVLTLDANTAGFADIEGANSAHIQSFSFTIPLTRTVLGRLGNTFGYTKVIDVPINMDITISAIVSELNSRNIFDTLCSVEKKNMQILLKNCDGDSKLWFGISGAQLVSETYSQNLGDNQTVDLVYSIQIGGANDLANGLFMSGSFTADTVTSGFYKLGAAKTGII